MFFMKQSIVNFHWKKVPEIKKIKFLSFEGNLKNPMVSSGKIFVSSFLALLPNENEKFKDLFHLILGAEKIVSS